MGACVVTLYITLKLSILEGLFDFFLYLTESKMHDPGSFFSLEHSSRSSTSSVRSTYIVAAALGETIHL